jgi:hypothetical protein
MREPFRRSRKETFSGYGLQLLEVLPAQRIERSKRSLRRIISSLVLFRVQVPEQGCGNSIGRLAVWEMADAVQQHAAASLTLR